MKKKQNLFLLILLSLFLLFGIQISVSAAVQSGNYTYTTTATGNYPNIKTTIYRQKNGSSSKQKLITVSGYATPKLVYKNLLYYAKDHVTDCELIDLWTYNLKTKQKTCIKKNATIRRQSGTNLLLVPNTGALVPLPCYIYNLTTGKSKLIDSASISMDLIDGKVYYAKSLSSKPSSQGYKIKLYSYNIKNGKKTVLSKPIYVNYCYEFTPKTVNYQSLGKTYKYTYSTGKSTRIS